MRDTQVTAISLLAMIETPASSAAPRLIELLLRSQNEDIRILAVGALPKVASSENLKSIIAVLGSTLKDKNQDVRFGSALSLAQLYENGNKTFISSGNTDAFKKIISKEVVPTLITALQDKDKDVRIATVEALGKIGKDAIPALISALQDKDKDVRTDTVYALGKIGKDAIPALISALQDKDKDVRTAAFIALVKIGKDAIPALISALQDKDKDVRTAAVEALWLIGNDVKIENRPAELFRSTIQIINKKNQPKACESNLAALLIGWKCPRK